MRGELRVRELEVLLHSDIMVSINWPSCSVGDAVEQNLGCAKHRLAGVAESSIHLEPDVLHFPHFITRQSTFSFQSLAASGG